MHDTRSNTEGTARVPPKVMYACSLDAGQVAREFALNKELCWLSGEEMKSSLKKKSLLI